MFKEVSVFKVNAAAWGRVMPMFDDVAPFSPCLPTQQQSVGMVPPRGDEHVALVEKVNGQYIMAFKVETKSVPGSTVKARVKELSLAIERDTGRKPGRKMLKELKEQATQDLLPQAFPKSKTVPVWFDSKNSLLVVGSASESLVDPIVTQLVKLAPAGQEDLKVSPLLVNKTHEDVAGLWLKAGAEFGFSVGRGCTLKAGDETKAQVVHKNRGVEGMPEVVDTLDQGYYCKSLQVEFDGKLAATWVDDLVLKGIEFLDVIEEHDADSFDASVVIETGVLSDALSSLIQALGGEWSGSAPAAG